MAEWLKAHAWKACVRQNRTVGSNPTLSAIGPIQVPSLASAGSANFGLSRRHFGSDLWTAGMEHSRVRFSDEPVFSEALYFADLVQSLKSLNSQALTKSRIRSRTRSATATCPVGKTRPQRQSRRSESV